MGLLDRFQSLFRQDRVDVEKRFEVLREAISGTMSKFYMARDRNNGRIVGLKVGDSEKIELFESRFKGLCKPPEGEIAKSFKHPLIVETYEYGRTTNDVPYLVMEYIEGTGMHALIHTRDQVLEGKRLKLIRQMAEALHVVHKAGYIHRDVCPRNFMLLPGAESLKLIDFGLTLPAKKEFMQPGNRTGTPLYMAPEIVRRKPTDHRLDIFAFGVTAYHLCALELPWPVGDMSGKDALAHDTVAPTPLEEYRPRIDRMLAKAIMQCMEPNLAKRTASFELFLRQVRELKSDDE